MLDFWRFLLYNSSMNNTASTITIERSEYDALTLEVEKLKALVEWYHHQLLSAKRRQFGVSSEATKVDANQISLFAELLPTLPQSEPVIEEIRYQRKKQVGKREKDLSGLPVERVEYELNEEERACPECGEVMRQVGVDVRRDLKLYPAQVVVVEHANHVYTCDKCEKADEKTPFLRGQAPAPLIPGSLASPSLVAHIAAQKYSNGMPLYRLEKGFSYDGVNISRQTMANWVIQCCQRFLEPIYRLLISNLLEETVLHADETTIQVLREDGRAPQTKSYEWVFRTSGCSQRKIVIYEYQQTRKQEHVQAFLKDFKGLLHTDGYYGYHNLSEWITVIGCWAHVRRKFEDILKSAKKDKYIAPNAQRGVAYIDALFKLEAEFATLTPEERHKKRLEKSKPISDEFFVWAATLGALPKSPLGQAAHYALSQQPYLENAWKDGRSEISNNRCERSVKSFVMGRKAWLFACTPAGAMASSVMYSLIETAKENGLHPTRYLEFLLTILPRSTSSQLESFLPWSDTLPDSCRAPSALKPVHSTVF